MWGAWQDFIFRLTGGCAADEWCGMLVKTDRGEGMRNHLAHTKWRRGLAAIACTLGIAALLGLLYQTGVLVPNALFAKRYTVRGVDVSAYQGTVNWKRLPGQSVDFAFIKATEGAGFQDRQFTHNWEYAQQAGLRVGAYHFFNFDVPASAQAENFIHTVPVQMNTLPPTVDVEFYGSFRQNHPNKETVRPMLDALLSSLEEHYGKKPILYCTESAYHTYLEGAYAGYPVWIRNVWFQPSAPANWAFWQYTDKGKLDGIEGRERFIDLNVFHGTEKEFQQFCRENTK